MRNFFLILYFLVGIRIAYSQQDSNSFNEKVIAPNIDATAIFKFSDTSADLSNGMLKLEIPLYTINLKELDIPVNLHYYSRGIKVSEIASSVGLGWSLNFGGIVSRQVRDKADDSRMGYLKHTYYKDMLNQELFDVRNLNSAFNSYEDLDLIPDRFLFSIADFSGEFLFDQKTGKILQQNASDIKIVPKYNSSKTIIGWEITDTKGNKYHFGVLTFLDNPKASTKRLNNFVGFNPQIRYRALGTSTDFYYDSWYLLQIETYYNEIVSYEYQPVHANYHAKQYDKRVLEGQGNEYETYYSKVIEASFILSKITFPLGTIEVKLNSEFRQDLTGGRSIESISMSNYKDTLLSQYTFNYDQKENDNLKNTYLLLPNLDESSKYRMFLTAVNFNDKVLQKEYSYKLKYNSLPLPNRFSTSQDAWGFFNDAKNETTLIIGDKTDMGVNNNFNGAGLLTSIEYPTGSIENFTYEGNLVMQDPENKTGDEAYRVVIKSSSISVLPKARCDELTPEGRVGKCIENGMLEKKITIPQNAVGPILIHFALNKFQHADFGPIDCSYTVEILYKGRVIQPYPSAGDTFLYPNLTNVASVSTLLPGHEYTIRIEGPYGCSYRVKDFATCRVSFEWKEKEGVVSPEGIFIFGEGKRIKKIETFSKNLLLKSREFSYLTEDGKNSGKLYGTLPYWQKLKTIGHLNLYVPFGLEDNSPMSSFRDTGLGYSNVVEYIEGTDKEKWGKINYAYTTFKNEGGGYFEWPFYLSINNEWIRGLLLSTKYYASLGGNDYQLQREEKHTYVFKVPKVPFVDLYVRNSFAPAPGTLLSPFYSRDFYKNDADGYMIPLIRFYRNYYDGEIDYRFLLLGSPENLYYKRYYLTGGKYELLQTDVIDYVGGQSIQTKYVNEYSTKHRFLKAQKIYTESEEKDIRYEYVADQSTNQGMYSSLLNRNRIAPLVHFQEFKNAETTQQKKYQYKNWGNNFMDLEQIEESKGDSNAYVNQKIIYRDNSSGNSLEIEQHGTKEVYLYGYNRSLLIAKITNASKEQIASALGVTLL
ncbi:hypothetical protein [Myroides odoratus]|uniref:hypothetical protein n=1 Tax=Myroides odoratus TaxID=256 RepID=UPI0039AFB53F